MFEGRRSYVICLLLLFERSSKSGRRKGDFINREAKRPANGASLNCFARSELNVVKCLLEVGIRWLEALRPASLELRLHQWPHLFPFAT